MSGHSRGLWDGGLGVAVILLQLGVASVAERTKEAEALPPVIQPAVHARSDAGCRPGSYLLILNQET